MTLPQPWSPAQATKLVNELAIRPSFTVCYTQHAKEQMLERDLIVGDVLYVLRHGFVYEEPEFSTRPGFYKYRIETRTPNSNNRLVRVVAIPDYRGCSIKLITVMWVDE
ncbi:MAG: DUF4258 domain-containing protein [Ancalomicrobiaceae bacterium]|nr:DUF4258 domain-containing protein [Ancalomicrobiaceae bacterium]